MLIPLPLRIAVLGVVAANAFMIPSTMSAPGMKDDGLDALSSYDISRNSDLRGVSGYLDCAGCDRPFLLDVDSSALLLSFVTSEDSKTILFNSVPIYPVSLDSTNPSPLVQVEPVGVEHRGFFPEGVSTHPSSLRYSGSASDLQLPSDDGWRSVAINITIESLDEEPVQLPTLQVHILEETETGVVKVLWVFVLVDNEMISTLEMLPRPKSKTLPAPVLQSSQSCGTGPLSIFCRLSAFLEAKFSSSSPSPHRQGGCRGRVGVKPPYVKGGPAKYWRYGDGAANARIQPMPFEPHHQPHGFMHQLHVFVISVVFPVLIGIAAGLTASLFGLAFGALIAWSWIKFIRGNKMGSVRKDEIVRCDIMSKEEQWVEGDGLLDEKAGFATHEERTIAEPPPGYVEKE